MKRLLIALLLIATPAMAQIGQNGFMNAASTDCSTANSCVELQSPANSGAVTFQLTGTFAGTVEFEGTVDGNTWVAMSGTPIAGGSSVTSATAVGAWRFGAAGLIRVRARTSAYTSGTAQVRLQSSLGDPGATSSGGGGTTSDVNVIEIGGNAVTTTIPVSGTVTVTDGAGALNTIVDSGTLTAVTTITNPVTITDGAGAVNTIVDSGTLTAVTTITNPVTVTSAQTGSGTATGAIRVELPTNGTGLVGLNAGTNGIGKLTSNAGVTIGAVEVAAAQTLATVTTVGTVTTLTGTTTLTPGTGAANLGKAEDAVAGSADTGVAILAVAQATPTATAADGDYIAPKTNANGVLWAQDIATGANAATKPANSEQAGAAGVNAEQTAVTNGQLTNLVSDLVGKLIVLPYANPENFVNGTVVTITDTTSTATIASAGGSLRNYVTHCTLSNSHATVSTQVQILDGATVIDQVYLAALGGGASLQYPVPLKGTAATAINIKPVTTGSNIVGMCNGYKGL